MIRILLMVLVPLLLPTLAFLAWSAVERRRAHDIAAGMRPPWYADVPWHVLLPAGAVLAAGVLFAMALTGGAPPGGVYTPAHVENGRIVEGTITPRQPPPPVPDDAGRSP